MCHVSLTRESILRAGLCEAFNCVVIGHGDAPVWYSVEVSLIERVSCGVFERTMFAFVSKWSGLFLLE